MTLSNNYYCIVHYFLSGNNCGFKQNGDQIQTGFKHFPVNSPTESILNVIVTVVVVVIVIS